MPVHAEATLDRTTVPLSGSVTLTISIHAPAPLRFDPPKEWLAEPSSAIWQMRPQGVPIIDVAANGEQVWKQSFRLDPFASGTPIPLQFNTLRVNDQDVSLPELAVTVTTSITEAMAEDARPVTSIERPPAVTADAARPWEYLIAGISVGIAMLAAVLIMRLRRKPTQTLSPSEVARRDLDRLDRQSPLFAQELGTILRRFRGGAAQHLSVEELRISQPEIDWSLLQRCETLRYSGATVDPATADELMLQAHRWIDTPEPLKPQ